jgi:hypothetical protein
LAKLVGILCRDHAAGRSINDDHRRSFDTLGSIAAGV